MQTPRCYPGFSLIEIMLSITVLAVLSAFSFVWFTNYQRQTETNSTSKTVVDILRDAQSRSISGRDFKKWGVYFDVSGERIVLFRDEGGGYAGAVVKEENYLSGFAKISDVSLNGGGREIIFDKARGETSQYGAIKIESKQDANMLATITITRLGLIYR